MKFHQHTLDNGLNIVGESNPGVHSVALGFFVRTGARDEASEVNGVSHFLEHMAFKGTERFTADDVNRIFDEVGAEYNASTSEEVTLFYGAILPEYLPQTFELLSSILYPTLRQDDFDMEKKVILEEIAMYRDRPDALIIDEVIQSAFSGHPLGQSVLGTEETVDGIQRSQMTDYLESRYAANNLTFVITGNYDQDAVIRAVEKACGSWESAEGGRSQTTPEFHPARKVEKREGVLREHIALAVPAPPAASEWSIVADLTADYLGASSNSRLFWSVVQQGLADEASADFYGFSDTGLFYIYLSVDPGNARQVMDIVNDELRGLKDGIDPEALARARTKMATSLVCSGENGLHRFSQIVGDLSTGTPLKTIDEQIAEIESVTPARIAEYLDLFPVDADPTLVALGPMESL